MYDIFIYIGWMCWVNNWLGSTIQNWNGLSFGLLLQKSSYLCFGTSWSRTFWAFSTTIKKKKRTRETKSNRLAHRDVHFTSGDISSTYLYLSIYICISI
jgi:hypothetical protein